MNPTCGFTGESDLYGLGIRIPFVIAVVEF
jgi:hypothetical protein